MIPCSSATERSDKTEATIKQTYFECAGGIVLVDRWYFQQGIANSTTRRLQNNGPGGSKQAKAKITAMQVSDNSSQT